MTQLRPALVMIVLFTLLTGLVFPLLFVGLGRVAMPGLAGGGLITRQGRVVGATLIGQNFTSPRYFHSRPSATVEPDPKDSSKTIPTPYAADNSAGSNLGPSATSLVDRVKGDLASYPKGTAVPADAVATSASGLDPDISPRNAALQLHRVALARHMTDAAVAAQVARQTRGRWLGLFGEPRVNVLQLNLALDAAG